MGLDAFEPGMQGDPNFAFGALINALRMAIGVAPVAAALRATARGLAGCDARGCRGRVVVRGSVDFGVRVDVTTAPDLITALKKGVSAKYACRCERASPCACVECAANGAAAAAAQGTCGHSGVSGARA
jgi:hypothetical protein